MMECVTLEREKKRILLLSTKMVNKSLNVDWKEVCSSSNICVYIDSVL